MAQTLTKQKTRKADPNAGAVTLLLVDDHEVVRIGLRNLLSDAGIRVVGEAGTAADAVRKAAALAPDVVLMDVRLPDASGVQACREILSARPSTHVLFLSSYTDEDAALATAFGGAHGYLLKEIRGEALITAIQAAASGQAVQDSPSIQPLLEKMRASGGAGIRQGIPYERLSGQELRVMALVAEGKTNKEIAAALDLSDKTVKNYLSNIFQKLQVSRRSQAAVEFIKSRRKTKGSQ